MTLEDYAYLSQIVGVLLILVSLLYVARQIKQGTAMMAAHASAERVQRDFDLTSAISSSREFAEIWARSMSDVSALDDVDRLRVQQFMHRAIVHWHNMYETRTQGLLPESDWNELRWLISFFGAHQGLRGTWDLFKPSFGRGFQGFLDERFAAGDTARST